MQLNPIELRHIENAIPSRTLPTNFQLPSLHASIPLTAAYVSHTSNYGVLGKMLLDAGVIDPDSIPDTAMTPDDVVSHGLRAWFMKRLGPLQHMRLDANLYNAETINAKFTDEDWNGLSYTRPAIALTGDIAEMRYVRDVALHVENLVPDFFLAAFDELVGASYKTVELHHPQRILEMEASYYLWENDIHSVTDEEAKEALFERHGEEVISEYYMPDEMLKAFGNGYCMDVTRVGNKPKKRRKFPDLQVKKLAKHEDKTVAAIAKRLLNLRRAKRRVEQLGATMDRPDMYCCRPLWVSCILLFSGDDRETHFMDNEHQSLMECGEGTDVFGIEQLPETVVETRHLFNKFDALLDLVTQMDALIPVISYSPYQE